VKLVFTGRPAPAIVACIAKNGLTERVHFTGVVAESELPSLYRKAIFLFFPSLYEGFGLPIVEAMACGTPVITSDVTAMPEIAGDAALLVDPTSIESMTKAITGLMEDGSLREELRAKGLARAAKFSWTTTIATVRKLLIAHSG